MESLTRPAPSPRRRFLRSLLSGGYAYLVLFLLVHAVLALTTDGAAVADVVVLVLVGLPQWMLVRTRVLSLPRSQAWLVVALCVAGTAAGLWTMAPYGHGDTYTAWFLGAATIDLLGMAVVGRFALAWLTMALMVVAVLVWGATHGVPQAAAAALIVRQVATLVVGTVLAIGLRRSNTAFEVFQTLRRRRGAEEGAARVRLAARRAAVEQVLEQAGPTLRALADARPISADDRRQLLVLEGALRDQIRAPGLRRGRLRDAVDAARHRGVNVLLMDEAGDAADEVRAPAIDWLAEQLATVSGGGFVGRLRRSSDGVRVSAVADEHSISRTFPTGSSASSEP